jgi:hypothetical protein
LKNFGQNIKGKNLQHWKETGSNARLLQHEQQQLILMKMEA